MSFLKTPNNQMNKFALSKQFISKYDNARPPWGFDGFGEVVFVRTYSRILTDGSKESWQDVIERVVNGLFRIRQDHLVGLNMPYEFPGEQALAQKIYDRMFNMKMLGSGRALWALGSPITEDRKLYGALFNCGAVSTSEIETELAKPFVWAFDSLCLGTGVGFDTKGAGKLLINTPLEETEKHVIGDSREDWATSLQVLLESYFIPGKKNIEFDYTEIRPAGQPLKGFGGLSSGFKPLKKMHEQIRTALEKNTESLITQTTIVDIFNHIGCSVVAGNIRRSAEIALGTMTDDNEFVDLKNYEKNPERMAWGWASNNTVVMEVGSDYSEIAKRIRDNGEPGVLWVENMQKYSRMRDSEADFKDKTATLTNPCAEITLNSYELCNLSETFPAAHDSYEDFQETLRMAFFFGKTIALCGNHWKETNSMMLKNRRVGVSQSGIVQAITKLGMNEYRNWCEKGYKFIQEYDRELSAEYAVPLSIKTTTVKPSGTLSLLAGATPGIHYGESRFYIRRVCIAKNHSLLNALHVAGYYIEEKVNDPDTMVVEFPIDAGQVKTIGDVTIYDQLNNCATLQRCWADNSVSATVTFNPETTTDAHICMALEHYDSQLKVISFLPKTDLGAYPQLPYEEIDEVTYKQRISEIDDIDLTSIYRPVALNLFQNGSSDSDLTRTRTQFACENDELPAELRFCTGDKCVL